MRDRDDSIAASEIPIRAHSRSNTLGKKLSSVSRRQSDEKTASVRNASGSTDLKNSHKEAELRFALMWRNRFSNARTKNSLFSSSIATFLFSIWSNNNSQQNFVKPSKW